MTPDPPTTPEQLAEDPADPPPDWVPVARFPSFEEADDTALALLATGFDCWLHPDDQGFRLLVPGPSAHRAQAEIQAYLADLDPNPTPRNVPPTTTSPHHAALLPVLWSLALVVIFHLQHSDPGLTDRALCSTTAILHHGQWWRAFTALFLHADIAHLAGNLFSGSVFGLLLARTIGPLPAITGILLSGTFGNLANATLHFPDDHRSIGASTAVFGALGMLSACGFFELLPLRRSLTRLRIIAPLVAGIILLAWMGGGSPDGPVDVSAHIAGFGCGWITGLLHHLIRRGTGLSPEPSR